jgi:hypothetical protein
MTYNLLCNKFFSIMWELENFLQLSNTSCEWFSVCNIEHGKQHSMFFWAYSLTNPLATPVLEEPPPPPTNTWRLVNICNVYNGKLTRAKSPSCFLRVGAIVLKTFHTQHVSEHQSRKFFVWYLVGTFSSTYFVNNWMWKSG